MKIRGYHVDLLEISKCINDIAQVRHSAVITVDDTLYAFYVGDIPWDSIEQHLMLHLPDYMIPYGGQQLPSLPLNSSSKVDTNALLSLLEKQTKEAPHRGTVAEIFKRYLSIGPFDEHLTFRKLGGDSISALRVINALNEKFGQFLTTELFWKNATVRQIKALIDSGKGYLEPCILPAPVPDEFPLSDTQAMMWLQQKLSPQGKEYLFYSFLDIDGPLNVDDLTNQVRRVVETNQTYGLSFHERAGIPFQKVSRPAVEVPIFTGEPRHILEQYLLEPFDLTKAPLARWGLVRLSSRRHVLIQVEHHLISDGWTHAHFMQQLFSKQVNVLQFSDYVQMQARWLEGPDAQKQKCYWSDKLCDAPLELPLKREKKHQQCLSSRGVTYKTHLQQDLWKRIQHYSQEHDCSPFTVFYGAYHVILAHACRMEELTIGTAVSNRRWPGATDIHGLLTNIIVLRNNVDLFKNFGEWIPHYLSRSTGYGVT